MEFPGLLGVWLYSLRGWIQRAPVAAMGPFLGIIAADAAIDISGQNYGSVGIELLIAPLLAMAIIFVARSPLPGMSGMLMMVLGFISALGASMLLPSQSVTGRHQS